MYNLIKTLLGKSDTDLKKLFSEGAVILDVRTNAEFLEGHIKGAKNIPLSELREKAGMIKQWNAKVITVCRSGARSASAKNILQAEGIEVYNGGAWPQLNKIIKK